MSNKVESFQNPDNSFYDAKEGKFYLSEEGLPMPMLSKWATKLKVKGAKKLSEVKVKQLREAADKRMKLSGKTGEKLSGKTVEELKESMGIRKYKSFVEWLAGEDFDLEISSGQLSEDLEINEHLRKNLREKVEEVMGKKEKDFSRAVDVLSRFFKFNKDNLKQIIPLIIEGWMTEYVQEKLRDVYKYIYDFERFKKGQCNVSLNLSVNEDGSLDSEIYLTGYEEEYKKHEAKKFK
ncbi:hypothetical protein GF366_03310, partial [Candidatus Peregrinibacteria bacterium]|nr:hypothetical protein [Candidatus Peregrinibacteria bacterium]